jgi:pathogenesis-related protein 1
MGDAVTIRRRDGIMRAMKHFLRLMVLVSCAGGSAALAQPGSYYLPPGSPPSALDENAMLAEHNAVRGRLKLPALRWSAHLADVARDWASHLIATGDFSHRPGNTFGENLYAVTGAYASTAQVFAAWAEESRAYDLRTNTCRGVCGHYTQIVWQSTRSVGCAAVSGGGRQVWVCDYDPAGNWEGHRPYGENAP